MAEQTTFHAISRFNHWIIAVAIIGLLCVGLSFEYMDKETRGWFRNIHKAAGVLVLIYAFWRVGWRMVQGFPETVAAGPAWQATASKITHYLLLAAVIVMPLSGLLWSLYAGRAVDVFGLFTVPAFEKNEGISEVFATVHEIAGKATAAIVLLHIAAALKHHVVDKDATLVRMATGRTTRRDT